MQCEQILYAQYYDSSMKRPVNTLPCFFITEKLTVTVISSLKQQIQENSYLFIFNNFLKLHSFHGIEDTCQKILPFIRPNSPWNNYVLPPY